MTTKEAEDRVTAYMHEWGTSDLVARVMCALYACGMVGKGEPEDDPEKASDLYKYLLHYGLDLVPWTE